MDMYHTETHPECHICGKTFVNRAEQRKHDKTCLKKASKLKYKEKNNKDHQGSPSVDLSAEGSASNSVIQTAIPAT